jgi:hypothetical protein
MRSHCFERLAPATTPSILRDPARIVYYNFCGPAMIVEVRKRYCEATGSMVAMRYRFGRIHRDGIFVEDEFSVQQRHSSVP